MGGSQSREGRRLPKNRDLSEACPTSRAPANSPMPRTAREEGRLHSGFPNSRVPSASEHRFTLFSKLLHAGHLGQSRANPILQTLTESLLRPDSAEWGAGNIVFLRENSHKVTFAIVTILKYTLQCFLASSR